MEWYYLKDGRQLGPVPETSIRAWLETGFLKPHELLWRSGMTDWAPAGEQPEFGGSGAGGSGAGGYGSGGVGRGVGTGGEGALFGPPLPPPAGFSALAGFWLRLGAYLIDSLLLSTVVLIAFWPKLQKGLTPDQLQADPTLLAVEFFLPLCYYTIMECSPWQATFGKKAFRLRVTDLEGRRIGLLRALLRHLGKILSGITLLMGYILAGFTVRKQALHDLLSGCLVVRE